MWYRHFWLCMPDLNEAIARDSYFFGVYLSSGRRRPCCKGSNALFFYPRKTGTGLMQRKKNQVQPNRSGGLYGQRHCSFLLLMTLNVLIENGDGFDYTMKDFERWTIAAGFKRIELLHLAGPTNAAIAYKK